MKHLLLLRHAKSDWNADYGNDHDRPLAHRGQEAAIRMGRFLTRTRCVPDQILSSSALRALHTVELAGEAGSWKVPLSVSKGLYGTTCENALRILREQQDDVQTLLVAGHEPTWSELTGRLVGDAYVKFPTAAVARIDFDVERWSEIDFGTGRLAWLVTPKLLGRAGVS